LLMGSRISGRLPSSTFRNSARLFSSNSADNSSAHTGFGAPTSFIQKYGIATYDGLFKFILDDPEVRPSFFHAFLPSLSITSSTRVDDHMNPFAKFQTLRNFIHKKENSEAIARLHGKDDIQVVSGGSEGVGTVAHRKATQILKEFVLRYDEIKLAFPLPSYDGRMDFVCKLENGQHVMVEMQVIPEDHWDRRALAYVAALYGNQLRKGGKWEHIEKVIGINILGGGKDDLKHWSDTPNEFVRHYKLQEQLHSKEEIYSNKPRFIDGIELFQYSIMNAPEREDTSESAKQEKQDWITFLKMAHRMQENDVKRIIKTPAVLRAFERATVSEMPRLVKQQYDAEDQKYNRYSEHMNAMKAKGEAEGERKGLAEGERKGLAEGERKGLSEAEKKVLRAAHAMKKSGNLSDADIAAVLDLTVTEVADIKVE